MRAGYIVAAALTALSFPAIAHEHASGIVKERMDMMEAMAKNMKAIGARIKAKRDVEAIKKEALALQAHAPHIPHLFPPGSTQPPTEAKPAIWRNFADFEAKAKALESASAKLANSAPNNLEAVTIQVRAVAETCSGCHDLYRAKK